VHKKETNLELSTLREKKLKKIIELISLKYI
jgi:hypothetical protein